MNEPMSAAQLARLANLRRIDAIGMIAAAGTGHIGGSLSAMDILACLYYQTLRIRPDDPDWPDRDRFILSKGHSVEGYYAILADRGFFPKAMLATYSQAGTALIGHPSTAVPGVDWSTGSLGHGLSVGVGIALGAKRQGKAFDTYVLMGDGELAEGSVWEAAMAGAAYGLDNLTAIIDRNGLQISGTTETVMPLEDLGAKWRAFGWDVTELDGHDHQALQAYFAQPASGPRCLIARTVKGKGCPAAENRAEWHHHVPNAQQAQEAYRVLEEGMGGRA